MARLRLIKDLELTKGIVLPTGTTMENYQWCDLIGRKGYIDYLQSSDSEWWEKVTEREQDDCNLPNITTPVKITWHLLKIDYRNAAITKVLNELNGIGVKPEHISITTVENEIWITYCA